MTDIEKYLSFSLTTFVAFGITFEVPVIVIVLVRVGIVSISKLKEIRPYVIVGSFVVGAIFTPRTCCPIDVGNTPVPAL